MGVGVHPENARRVRHIIPKPEYVEDFSENGGIILAVKMLDQGVDIPAIDHAIFISSSRNEKG